MNNSFAETYSYLSRLAKDVLAECIFEKEVSFPDYHGKLPLLLPSGDEKYMSFWVRDCVMMAESGLLSPELIKTYIGIFATYGQNNENPLLLEHGLSVPPFAVADHINYNGRPVYYPGTYSDGLDQGNGDFGFYPPFCDNFYFVLMVWYYFRQGGDREILQEVYNGYSLQTRLEKAFACYQIDEETQLCFGKEQKFTVDWGFADSIHKSGYLLMPSLLRYAAAKAMAEMLSRDYEQIAKTIAENVKRVFYNHHTGWLYSATGRCHQQDVWGTAYAVYLGILREDDTFRALEKGYLEKTAVRHGQVRHILTTDDFAPDTAWELAVCKGNTYQNGGYWATATGWYAGALAGYNKDLAWKIIEDFVAHTKKFAHQGAPYEWINKDTSDYSGCRYGTSAVLPYIACKEKLL